MCEVILVPTPIGNLEDLTFRALAVLKSAGLIAAEDTRHTKILLNHYGVDAPTVSLHKDNEHSRVPSLLQQIQDRDLTLAVVTDAGTPGISDPGYLLVREAIKLNIKVTALPGATAFVPALVQSGLPCDKFVFEGFLPVKKGRQTRLKLLAEEERTIIFYESPHRLLKTIEEMIPHFGAERQACVCKELSKLHEETTRGTLEQLQKHFSQQNVRGEYVVVVAGKA